VLQGGILHVLHQQQQQVEQSMHPMGICAGPEAAI
jgi:hypothetical protein